MYICQSASQAICIADMSPSFAYRPIEKRKKDNILGHFCFIWIDSEELQEMQGGERGGAGNAGNGPDYSNPGPCGKALAYVAPAYLPICSAKLGCVYTHLSPSTAWGSVL